MVRIANDILCFALELFMLASVVIFGFSLYWPLMLKIVFTICMLAVVIALWAILAAPKSNRRLQMPYLALFRAVLFSLAAFLFYKTGYDTIALVVFVLAIVSQTVSLFTNKN